MTVALLVRRLHVYLGALLVPWFLMFGISSLLLNHPAWFAATGESAAQLWTTVSEQRADLSVPPDADLRAVGAQILSMTGVSAERGYGVGRPNPRRINVNVSNFIHPIRVSYFVGEHRMLVEKRAFATAPVLTGMHTHDGYYLRNGWQTAWAVVVDGLCAAIVFWIASGLYMWWTLRGSRRLGWAAIAAGIGSFATLMLTL